MKENVSISISKVSSEKIKRRHRYGLDVSYHPANIFLQDICFVRRANIQQDDDLFCRYYCQRGKIIIHPQNISRWKSISSVEEYAHRKRQSPNSGISLTSGLDICILSCGIAVNQRGV